MNFIAIIGIIQELKKLDDQTCEIKIKVEKPFYRENEQWYEILSVWLNRELFNEELKAMSEGMIIGVKGRINNLNDRNQIIGERVQLF